LLCKAFDWSADSKNWLYIRFDESEVPEFSMSMFNKDLYPTVETFKYPKAGENAVVSLHLFDVTTKTAKNSRFRKIKIFILQECNGQKMPMYYRLRF
jgi:dipeptidyl-peptidase-4